MPSPATTPTAYHPQPTARQRRILTVLASRYDARIKYTPFGYLITDGHGWADYLTSRLILSRHLNDLSRNGWIIQQRDYYGRYEYAISMAGRDAIGSPAAKGGQP